MSDQTNLKPEWIRIPTAVHLFGIGRATLTKWIAEGKIRSSNIRERGKQRGIRLISYDSLNEFIASNAEEAK